MNVYSYGFSHMIKHNKSMVASGRNAKVSLFCVRLTSKRWFLRIVQVTMDTWSIRCHVGVHVDFISILHSHTLLVPQALCEANLDVLRLFHQWECLKCNGHGLLVLCVKWPSRMLISAHALRPSDNLVPITNPREVCTLYKLHAHMKGFHILYFIVLKVPLGGFFGGFPFPCLQLIVYPRTKGFS